MLLDVELGAQRFAFYEEHDIEQQPAGFARVEQRQQVRMLQVRRDFDFGEKRSTPRTALSSGRRTLSATCRSCLTSRARNTVAIPPAPTSRSTA